MNSKSYDIDSSPGITHMPEAILESNSDQPLITTNDADNTNEEKHLLSSQDNLLQSNHLFVLKYYHHFNLSCKFKFR